ncbi:hypothetical protein CC79DRAFT_1332101 [Sarocladium strictum]
MGDRPLVYFILFRNDGQGPFQLCDDQSALNFKERNFGYNLLTSGLREFAKTIKPGARRSEKVIREETALNVPIGTMHAFHHPEGLIATMLSDEKYDMVAAQMVMNKAIDKFMEENPRTEWSSGSKTFYAPKIEGQAICQAFKDPSQVNKLASIQKDLDETMETLRKAIQQTTIRGEQLDQMVEKSENLNSASKMFYQQAKKQNSCCVLM